MEKEKKIRKKTIDDVLEMVKYHQKELEKDLKGMKK